MNRISPQTMINSTLKDFQTGQLTSRSQNQLFQKVQQLEIQNELFQSQIQELQKQKVLDDRTMKSQFHTIQQEIYNIRHPVAHRRTVTETQRSYKKQSYDFNEKFQYPTSPIIIDQSISQELFRFFSMSKETPVIQELCKGSFSSYQLAIDYLNKKQYNILLAQLLPLFNNLIDSLRNVVIPQIDTEAYRIKTLKNDDLKQDNRAKIEGIHYKNIEIDTDSDSEQEIKSCRLRSSDVQEFVGMRQTLSSIHMTDQSSQNLPLSMLSQVNLINKGNLKTPRKTNHSLHNPQ